MRSIFVHLSSLAGLLVLVRHLMRASALEETMVLAFGTGMACYVVLALGYAVMRHVLDPAPPPAAPEPPAAEVAETAEAAAS
ncbi:MAG: hypothetical protein R3247_14130 [Rhodothermales bacterium]|nr:hypothetical protein [Rhodothermales bacterium]